MNGGAGNDVLVSIDVPDRTTGIPTLTGNADADELNGGTGDDILGGDANDTLSGGTGVDQFVVFNDGSQGTTTITDLDVGTEVVVVVVPDDFDDTLFYQDGPDGAEVVVDDVVVAVIQGTTAETLQNQGDAVEYVRISELDFS
jgi:Ca2+-binding RTX toxin-like protein